jgi:hypothetical protein
MRVKSTLKPPGQRFIDGGDPLKEIDLHGGWPGVKQAMQHARLFMLGSYPQCRSEGYGVAVVLIFARHGAPYILPRKSKIIQKPA